MSIACDGHKVILQIHRQDEKPSMNSFMDGHRILSVCKQGQDERPVPTGESVRNQLEFVAQWDDERILSKQQQYSSAPTRTLNIPREKQGSVDALSPQSTLETYFPVPTLLVFQALRCDCENCANSQECQNCSLSSSDTGVDITKSFQVRFSMGT